MFLVSMLLFMHVIKKCFLMWNKKILKHATSSPVVRSDMQYSRKMLLADSAEPLNILSTTMPGSEAWGMHGEDGTGQERGGAGRRILSSVSGHAAQHNGS